MNEIKKDLQHMFDFPDSTVTTAAIHIPFALHGKNGQVMLCLANFRDNNYKAS